MELAAQNEIKISDHGYDELADDDIRAGDVIDGIQNARTIEENSNYPKGPCVLVLQTDAEEKPFHGVWGIPRGGGKPAVLVTAYRPDPARWTEDFTRRK